ncbi:hypothetical protein NFI96_029611 [Prochilodus magdalenae]|nr:hypothetical protein NFI96_029611 [Prochilodus magdalenae]
MACPPGLFSTEDGVDCRLCPTGFSCDGDLTACQSGQYSPEGHLQCLPCPFGYVCLNGFQIKCEPGEEPNLNRTKCTECDKGSYSTLYSGQCELCPAGSYCPNRRMSRPLPCPIGQYTDMAGQSSCRSCNGSITCKDAAVQVRSRTDQLGQRNRMPQSCPPGMYRDGEGPGCDVCPLGHYCVGGIAIQCPAGTYGPKEGLQRERDCAVCPAGFYCLEGTSRRPSSQFLCPQGYYCEEGTAVPHGSPCPAGTAGGQLGQTSRAACKRCAEGRYCPAGVKDCLKCPAGFYCPEGTSDPLPCQPGTFNPLDGQDALADCRPCYPGKACTQVALKAPDVDCMPGFVCPPGTARPNDPANACPPGTMSNRTDLTDRSQCQQCPARYACLRGTGGFQRPPLSCFAGHYCPAGTMFATQHKCPAGTWSERSGLESESECRPCPRGWYCLAGVGAPSGRCSSGHYCPEGTMYGTQFPCPRGSYSTKIGNDGREDCVVCPEGYYCREGSSKPTPCPPTTFRQIKGGQRPEDCSVCPAGYFCPHSATVNPRVCGAGSYSDEGSDECLPCLPGHYCSDETTSEEAMLRVMVCPAGFLCSQGLDREPQRSAVLCPIGFYCPGGRVNPNPIACPNGTYSQQPGLRNPSDCTVCPEGMYCFSQQPQEQPITEPTGGCPDGYHCPVGTGHPLSFPCESGFFRNESYGHDGGACATCPARHYCAGVATHTPSVCPEGFYCPEGSSAPEPCEEGTYSSRPALREASECTPCGGGKYCAGVGKTEPSGDCEAGFYCSRRSTSATPVDGQTGGLCPPGSFCPPGSAHPEPCPSGTFSNSTGLRQVKQCVKCPAGYYCLGSNSTSPTGLCSAGYYCTGSSASPIQHQAEEGHYSLEGAVKAEPCPLGTSQPRRGQSSCIECQPGRLCNKTGLSQQPLCPPGHYCPSGTSNAHPCPPVNYRSGDVCPVGYYCPKGTRHSRQYPCPPGTWSNMFGAQNLSACWPCPPGMFCNNTGLTQPTGVCAAGATECSDCPPGWLCMEGEEAQLCPEGHYCLGGTVEDILPCPPGTYSPNAGQRQVEQCSLCSAGSGTEGGLCPQAHYCPPGSSIPFPCPAGTYTNLTGQIKCSPCPAGYYCLESINNYTHFPCPPGFYCPDGTRHATQFPCPRGYYNPEPMTQSLDSCLPCPPGHYCEKERLTAVSGKCKAGWFCVSAAWNPQPFDLDNYTNANCLCPATSTGGRCQAGFYCPSGSSEPIPCPPGTFCNATGLPLPSGPCAPGYYCTGEATESKPTDGITGDICPPGFYCAEGSRDPESCPSGTFSSAAGLESQAQCQLCRAGHYCSFRGLRAPTALCSQGFYCDESFGVANVSVLQPCPKGHYCPKGTGYGMQFPCPTGTYNPREGMDSLSGCLPCPSGHFCPTVGLAEPAGLCFSGFWCKEGSNTASPSAGPSGSFCPVGHYCPTGRFYCPEGTGYEWRPCPLGTYSPELGLSTVSQCRQCDGGHYCSHQNATSVSGECFAGYHCARGNISPQPLALSASEGAGEGGPCPAGHYCPRGSTDPQPCPEGTFSNRTKLTSQDECIHCTPGHYCDTSGLTAPTGQCWEGFYCRQGASLPNALIRDHRGGPCPTGYFCPRGSSVPQACPQGSISSSEGQASCSLCPRGYYCPANGSVAEGIDCPIGHYCLTGTSLKNQYPCPAGTINPYTRMVRPEDCVSCPPGFFCKASGQSTASGPCQAGYFCHSGAVSPTPDDGVTGNQCPPGHYCPTGSSSPLPCPLGQYSNISRNTELSSCLPCPAGFACSSRGLSAPSHVCHAGYHCPQGQNSSQPAEYLCSPGHMCPPGSPTQIPCASGTYQSLHGQAECLLCLPGFFCAGSVDPDTGFTGGTKAPAPCPMGHYCPAAQLFSTGASSGQEFHCPVGTYSGKFGLSSVEQCVPCPAGKYCASSGLSAPTGDCSPGYVCIQGASLSQPPGDSTGRKCTAGFYCPAGTSHMQPCPPGTYSSLEGAASIEDCQPCTPGQYCAEYGLSSPSGPCSPGYYCTLRASSPTPYHNRSTDFKERTHTTEDEFLALVQMTGDICVRGHYCPSGSVQPVPCPPGTFLSGRGAVSESDCDPCVPGFYCPNWAQSSVELSCPEGWFCPAGTAMAYKSGQQCPPGHACPYGSVKPAICLSGTYQSQPAQPSCHPCPPGFYCLEGASAPVPCPAGTVSQVKGLHSLLDCPTCPPGLYCNSTALTSPSGPCSAGHFCSSGATETAPVSQRYGDICPAGYYCPEQSSAPLPCPVGHYLADKGASSWDSCSPCPPGRYCHLLGSSQPSGFCSPGHYCTRGAETAAPQAKPIQFRCFCDFIPQSSRSEYSICGHRDNTTCSVHSQESGVGECTGADLRPDSDSVQTEVNSATLEVTQDICTDFRGDICPKGFYCPIGSSVPQPCDAGSHCNQTGLHAPAGLCTAGFYCPKGSSTPHATPCPAGHYCPRGTPLPLPCLAGTLRNTDGGASLEDCLICPSGGFCDQRGLTQPSGLCSEGYYCPGGQNSSRPSEHKCRAGHYCAEGSVSDRACPMGSYQPSEGQHKCEVCLAGFSCPEEGMTHPIPCRPGFFCPAGIANQQPCPAGTYGKQSGLTDSSECTLCDPGTYCAGAGNTSPSGPCTAGFLCFGGASIPSPADNVTGSQCPPGFYCLTGSFTATPCPKGTFSGQFGLTEAAQCQSCSPGFYCSEPGLTAVSGPCLPGFFCSEGSSTAAPVSAVYGDRCPPGHYCDSGSAVPTPCQVGTHRSESGGKSVEDCMPCPGGLFQDQRGQRDCKSCPPGFHCPSSSQLSNEGSAPLICPEGYYCPNETVGRPVPCPKGTYSNNQGLTSADECLACPLGYFCGSDGLVQPSGPCASGFLCFVHAIVPNPTDNNTGSLCPPGAYCQLGIRTGDCSPGYYCDWGSSSPEQRLCPAGFYCPSGIDKPIACGGGTFSSVMGNSERENCEPCPEGYYCQGDGVVKPATCSQGFYCPQGSVTGTEFPCPPGTVQPHAGASSEEDCLPCPSGMFCALPGLTEPTGRCQDGYHCPPGAISPNATGHRMESAGNNMCPPGHYCPVGTGYPLPCPPGTLSSSPGLSMMEQCQPCPPGHFCEQPALAHPNYAFLCDAGYVCLGGSRTARPVDGLEGYLCPSGHSCPVGSPLEVPCEPGSYSTAPGAARCLFCPPGTMCPSSATQEPLPCPKGYFCPAGTATALPCPVGTLGQVTRAQSESTCVPCPTGLYCSLPGSSQPQGQCQQGYFCQSGSADPAPLNTSGTLRNGPCPQGHFCPSGTLTPLPCPAGSMRNLSGGYSMESCFPCPAGHYCASEGLDSPTGPCAAGFYCPVDFSSTTPHAFLCPKGHYCPSGSPLALPCPTGQYQPNPGSDSCIPCRPGFYCEEAIVGDPLPCPPHSYCPAATMVPQPCPNGTYTLADVGGLQDERECLPCPPGRFCRGGQIKGLCAAGYMCVTGSSDFTPQGPVVANRSQCEWGVQCAGPCPTGFYCPEGTELPQACPANTLIETPGGRSVQDCLPCPRRHWCKEGDPVLYMCPVGHYCDGISDYESAGRPGPRECPLFTYRPTPGAGSKGDCLLCPPGTFCNATGIIDFSSFPCPPGHWCSGTGLPVPCPAGTLRAQPGAASASQCEPCVAGTYCPDPRLKGQPNTAGIICRASYQCPTGSVVETPCRAGSYCRTQTGEPTPCPAGYYCPEGSYTYNTPQQICTYPYYCPVNSSAMLSCGGGFMPRNISGLRVSHDSSCVLCEAGTYRPSHSVHLRCLACPPGYHCPQGVEHYSGQPCPMGYVCPRGSFNPVPCPPGTYGNRTNAELLEECQQCPPGTFNHLNAQRACFPCGSSSTSDKGASSCMCIGKNRVFQHSDGSCLCKAGYVFYNELDFKSSTADSDLDCQPELNKRCGAGQVRLASSQECVSPSRYSCNITCGPQGGSLDVGLGICHCQRYVSAEEVCNSSCVSTLPELSARFAQDGQLMLRIKAKDESRMWNRNMINVLGPDSHVNNIGKIHFVQFSTEGVFGWILKDTVLIDTFLSEPFEILEGGPRKKRHSNKSDLLISGILPRIPNPIACLNPSDMLIFQLTINYTDRLRSHFPVYQKDHLFSSNPAWDFGAFRRLERLIKHSQFNSTRFAHVFMDPGKYVFLDNAVPDWSLVVVVRDEGTQCDPAAAVFQPTLPAQLVRHGVIKQQRLNLLPDWSAILGILALLVLLIVVLTVSALLLRPNRASFIGQGRPKPKWRSLGEPNVPVEFVYNGDCDFMNIESFFFTLSNSSDLLRFRGVGEGAESEEPSVCKGYKNALIELEEFNVKTLYDKLEDQNLHLASQLAKHRKDTQEFYRNMCQQTDALREALENMEPSKLIQWKKMIYSDSQVKAESIRVEPWMGLMEAVQRSLEAVLCRLNGEAYQQQEGAVSSSHRDTRESELHTGYTQISSADISEAKARPDREAASSDPVPQSSTAPCVSEEDLARLVALTPLTKTLQDIQQSLQALSDRPTAEEEVMSMFTNPDDTVERQPTHLIPVALDNLSPRSFAVFLYGCHVVRLLNRASSFPAVMLLLAKALPVTHTDSLLAYCNKQFYYDTSNQILYILESELQNAGQFISILLHSMAYISSGTEIIFMHLYVNVS